MYWKEYPTKAMNMDRRILVIGHLLNPRAFRTSANPDDGNVMFSNDPVKMTPLWSWLYRSNDASPHDASPDDRTSGGGETSKKLIHAFLQ
jgi:hypothetical protein